MYDEEEIRKMIREDLQQRLCNNAERYHKEVIENYTMRDSLQVSLIASRLEDERTDLIIKLQENDQ